MANYLENVKFPSPGVGRRSPDLALLAFTFVNKGNSPRRETRSSEKTFSERKNGWVAKLTLSSYADAS